MTAQQSPQARSVGLLRWPTYALGKLHRLARTRLDEALRKKGLSIPAYFVLVSLHEDGELSQQQVCDRLTVDRSDMVKLVDKLEAGGLVTRRRDTVDRRRQLLTLTTAGHRALRQGERIIEQVTGDVLVNLSADERQTLHRLVLRALGEHTHHTP